MNMVAFVQKPRAIAEIAAQGVRAGPGVVYAIAGQVMAVARPADEAISLRRPSPARHDAGGFERVRESDPTRAASDLHRQSRQNQQEGLEAVPHQSHPESSHWVR